jgi:hypothetical protein
LLESDSHNTRIPEARDCIAGQQRCKVASRDATFEGDAPSPTRVGAPNSVPFAWKGPPPVAGIFHNTRLFLDPQADKTMLRAGPATGLVPMRRQPREDRPRRATGGQRRRRADEPPADLSRRRRHTPARCPRESDNRPTGRRAIPRRYLDQPFCSIFRASQRLRGAVFTSCLAWIACFPV